MKKISKVIVNDKIMLCMVIDYIDMSLYIQYNNDTVESCISAACTRFTFHFCAKFPNCLKKFFYIIMTKKKHSIRNHKNLRLVIPNTFRENKGEVSENSVILKQPVRYLNSRELYPKTHDARES